jgi:hypothetical protein
MIFTRLTCDVTIPIVKRCELSSSHTLTQEGNVHSTFRDHDGPLVTNSPVQLPPCSGR